MALAHDIITRSGTDSTADVDIKDIVDVLARKQPVCTAALRVSNANAVVLQRIYTDQIKATLQAT